ncbi:MAG TPA: butyrate kinase [Bacteroidales bacterium]|nr:butyrate kinase [Bacteroidales bacterium]HPS61622.1 butyrate kinase [Bacteroidales bacterium]
MIPFNILVVNPKDYVTQVAIYQNHKLLYMISRRHSAEELSTFHSIYDQVQFRRDSVLREIRNNDFGLDDMKIVISRGGLIKPVQSGVYAVNDVLKQDLLHSPVGDDIINIAGLLADAIAAVVPGSIALIADPTVVDEFHELARITGAPEIKRKSIFHALNQKAVAKMHAETHKRKYEEMNLIVAHIGNGTTVGAHRRGRVIDVNQGFEGDGPFSMVRSGSLPLGDIVRMCFSGEKTLDQMLCLLTHCAGVNAYLGTRDIDDIETRINNGDSYARLIMEAMAYQVSKSIGEMFAVLKGEADAILITGDIAHSQFVVNHIIEHVEKFAPIFLYPGDNELQAMAGNALRVLKGEMQVQEYI